MKVADYHVVCIEIFIIIIINLRFWWSNPQQS